MDRLGKNSTSSNAGTGTVSLADLLAGLEYSVVSADSQACLQTVVTSVRIDSRLVEHGDLFVAVAGAVTDGHLFIEKAVGRGCAAVVVEKGAKRTIPEDWNGCVIEVADSRKAYAAAAENYFGNPADGMKLVGITGTNGKTTITYLLEQMLTKQGLRVGVIGTVNYRYSGRNGKVVMPSPFTTPEAMQLQQLLSEMAEAGVEYVIMEVSSHALAQSRIGNIQFDVAVFTNLSRDHLDYHRTMEEYFQSKSLLFISHLKSVSQAVISTPLQQADDIDWSARMATLCRESGREIIRAGQGENADIKLLAYSTHLTETKLQLIVGDTAYSVTTPLVGHFNVDNLLTSLAVAGALGLELESVIEEVANISGAPGRLERVLADDGTGRESPVVFVDYAHTPDALKQVLMTVTALPHRELFCVFGCGGDRDAGKRPVMGGFAGGFADVAVVTDDNPRTEDPDEIRRQISPGVARAGLERKSEEWLSTREIGEKGFVEIGSRRAAICEAIKAAGPGDIVLIAGKGHEKYQLGIHGKQFFDDCLEAKAALLSWNLHSVMAATGGACREKYLSANLLGDVSTDSRTIKKNDIFVALRGDNFDGHDFLLKVEEKGAGCLVVQKGCGEAQKLMVPRIEVDDTLKALGDLAAFRRRLISSMQELAVIAVTGSCGKTTVKEMAGSILRRKWPAGADYPEDCVLQTKGNLNNLIGMPLSLLPLSLHHRAAVLEMGMNVPGEICEMAKIAAPDICCITNVHGVHLEGLGTIEGVAAAKEELFAEASDEAVLIVNLDDPNIAERAGKYSQQKITFTVKEDRPRTGADLFVSDVQTTGDGVLTFLLHKGEESEEIQIYTAGLHNVANAAAAAAIAVAAGASMKEIADGLADFRPADRRMVIEKLKGGLQIINDTYNANPASMTAGLQTLSELSRGKKAAVLGDMFELGLTARELHRDLGRKAATYELDYLGVVGEFGEDVVRGALEAGMDDVRVKSFPDKVSAAAWIDELRAVGELAEGDWLLVKGSRGMRMETVVAELTGKD